MAIRKRHDENNLPLTRDYAVDVALPARAYENFVPERGPRRLLRPLTEAERAQVERRARALESALLPFARPDEDDRVALAVSEMFGSFSSMRLTGAEAVARLASAMRALEPLPAWAIEKACLDVRRRGHEVADAASGRARLEQTWAPSDSQLFAVAERAAAPRAQALRAALALLEAPCVLPGEERTVGDMLAEFKAQTTAGRVVDAEEAAAAEREAAARGLELANAERRAEYAARGLEPPEPRGGQVTSLAMMLKMGATIEEVAGRNVLVAPWLASRGAREDGR